MMMAVERFTDLLLAADVQTAWEEIIRYQQAGCNPLFLYHRLFTPALVRIGSYWEQGEITVAEEHLATAACDLLLTRYDQQLPAPAACRKPPRAMLFCVEQERHVLGLKMVESLFRQEGWDVRFFGADLPLDYAVTHAARWKPDAIGISASMTMFLPQVGAAVSALEKLENRPMLLVGGRAVKAATFTAADSDRTLVCPDLLAVANWLDAQSAERGRRDEGGSAHAIS